MLIISFILLMPLPTYAMKLRLIITPDDYADDITPLSFQITPSMLICLIRLRFLLPPCCHAEMRCRCHCRLLLFDDVMRHYAMLMPSFRYAFSL